ncbi:MAG: TIR domain-containing protein [Gammaproteobacteria bacterium]|nr:TIR domain-containing protein [Gammaproteobacteria bacterium]
MMKIFISYRRSDSQMVAGRLRESLARRLGYDAIFRDKDSIGAGEDWTRAIEESLTENTIVMALIGPDWATALDKSGTRRLDDPADWNRVELELALKRSARVIPLLIDETRMPQESELPPSLELVARIHALKLRDDDWDSDIKRLMQALGLHKERPWKQRPFVLTTAIAAVIAIGAAVYWWSMPTNESPVSTTSTQEEVASKPSEVGGSYLADIKKKLHAEQEKGLNLLFSTKHSDRAMAIGLIDASLGNIDKALQSFPNDVYLRSLAGYAAKNVYASSGGTGLLGQDQRKKYLAQARLHFETALKINPRDPGALNGMGNVLFYEHRLDEAIQHHEQALKLAGGSYPAAKHDLDLVKRVKSGAVLFPE